MTIIIGDCREVLPTLPDASVQCVVTSPPYYGLRDYGTGIWTSGDPACGHQEVPPQNRPGRETPGGRGGSFPTCERAYKSVCQRCGAHRVDRQIGLEATPEAYMTQLVAVFRAVRRVLRDDGTLWLNLGDTYGAGGGNYFAGLPMAASRCDGASRSTAATARARGDLGEREVHSGLRAKNLLGIPWRVAFALQADGWYLRADLIWSKPNPMPESVTDRPTKAHEYVFLLTKSARYYYDGKAIAEPAIHAGKIVALGPKSLSRGQAIGTGVRMSGNALVDSVTVTSDRNARSVWSIASACYPDAHFATFPPELARRCLLAGSRMGDVVLDPFAGSGTVGEVAEQNGRHAILIELNPAYGALIRDRTMQRGLFCQEAR
jgi:DNA modification methylase